MLKIIPLIGTKPRYYGIGALLLIWGPSPFFRTYSLSSKWLIYYQVCKNYCKLHTRNQPLRTKEL